MESSESLNLVIILLGFAVIAVSALRRVRLPPILAYLFTGMLVGPHGVGWITNTEDTQVLAEYGVVFLLFTLGLEFSLSRLIAMKRDVLLLGGGQVVVNVIGAGVVAWLCGATPGAAVALGGALAMSSTAIVIKQIKEQSEVDLRHGRLAVAVLLFQDLAVIPFLILIPALASGGGVGIASSLLWAMVKGTAAFLVILVVGRWLLRPLFLEIASSRLAELFTLAVLFFTLAAAWLTEALGLSLALGAFLAGIMLGETEFRHQVELEIRPFRDVLLGLFFVSVGMLVNVGVIVQHGGWVMLAVLALILFKCASVAVLGRVFGSDNATALRTGLLLAQGGEFGFALLALGLTSGLVTPAVTQFALAVILVSMIVSPVLIRVNRPLAQKLFGPTEASPRDVLKHDVARHSFHNEEHVIIAGFGRVGQNVARLLEQEGFEYVALDLDPVRVKAAREGGDPVYYGDATHPDILHAVGLERARAVVISYHDVPTAVKILAQVRKSRPELPVIVRTRDDSNLDRLQAAGATEVVPEALEAGLMVASHLLVLLDVPIIRIMRRVEEVRHDRYSLLRNVFRGQEARPLDERHAFREELRTVKLGDGDHAVALRLSDLALAQCAVMVTALRRHGIVGKQPGPDTRLRTGDVLVLYGTPDDLAAAEKILRRGTAAAVESQQTEVL